MGAEKVFKYFVANGNVHKTCQRCEMPTIPCKCEIPVYNKDGSLFKFYQTTLSYCWNCDMYWIGDYYFDSLAYYFNSFPDKKCIKPGNKRAVFSNSNRKYIYLDISEKNGLAGFEWWEDEDDDPYIKPDDRDWNKTSILKRMGYDVKRSTVIRHSILEEAAKKYSKGQVLSFLNFLINLQKNHPNDYSQSISIWQSDLEFVRNLRL